MKIKLSKKKQVLKESKQKEKNFFRATDSAEETFQERVDHILREEFESVIAEKVNPLEIKRQICDKKSMILKAIEAGQVNNMLWWAEALDIIPDEMEAARASLQKLLGTDPDKLLQIPGAKEGAIAAIEMMCMIPLEETIDVKGDKQMREGTLNEVVGAGRAQRSSRRRLRGVKLRRAYANIKKLQKMWDQSRDKWENSKCMQSIRSGGETTC